VGEWDFNIDFGIEDNKLKQRALKRVVKNNQIHFIKAKALSDLCKKPKPNEQYRIITEKQFNAYALILYTLESELILEMYLAIYRINEPTVSSIIDFIEAGKIKKAIFIISNFFNHTKRPEKWALQLKAWCDSTKKDVKHIYTHNHSKVLAIRTKKNYYIFEGSGNMSDNARIEQYIFENNKQVFDFHKQWMLELTKYETIIL